MIAHEPGSKTDWRENQRARRGEKRCVPLAGKSQHSGERTLLPLRKERASERGEVLALKRFLGVSDSKVPMEKLDLLPFYFGSDGLKRDFRRCLALLECLGFML